MWGGGERYPVLTPHRAMSSLYQCIILQTNQTNTYFDLFAVVAGSWKIIERGSAHWCTSAPFMQEVWTAKDMCVSLPSSSPVRFYILWSKDPLQQIQTVIKDNFMKQLEEEVTEDEEEREGSQQVFGTFSV